MAGAQPFVDKKLAQRKVMLFSKSYVPECKMVKAVLSEYKLNDYEAVEIEKRQDCTQIENYFQILCLTNNRAVPQLFVDGKYIGGYNEVTRWHKSGKLLEIFKEHGAVQ